VDRASFLKAQVKVGDGSAYNFCTETSDMPSSDGVRQASWVIKLTKPASRSDVFSSGIKLRLRMEDSEGRDVVLAKGALGDGSPLFEYENQWVMLTGNLHDKSGGVVGSYSSYMKFRPEGSAPDFSYDTPRENSPRAYVRSETSALADAQAAGVEGGDSLETPSVTGAQGGFLEVQFLRFTHLKAVGT
jgi:hypothetical protein